MDVLMANLQGVLGDALGLPKSENTSAASASDPSATKSLQSTSLPSGILSIVTMLLSFSALRDWLKLIVIGGIFESCRRMGTQLYSRFINSFFITATFNEDDDSYDWMMVWLSKQPGWCQARELQISTKAFGLRESAVLVPGEDEDAEALAKGSRKLAYMPSMATTHTMWYKSRWMTVTRGSEQSGYYMRQEERLTICMMSRSHHRLNELLLEAKKTYKAAQEDNVSVYVSDMHNDWRHASSRPKRPLRSIILDPGIKDLLLDDARDFLESKFWYQVRGIPFRRGYLLYGVPGSGKTSVIHSLAGELGLDVYIITLSKMGMDDGALAELVSNLPEKCIALMEDIDAAFTQSLNRDASAIPTSDSSAEPSEGTGSRPGEGPGGPARSGSRVTLSGLLNALDGVGAQEGRILFATTNKYTSLDPALCRPGRMDIHIEFKLASKYQAKELFRCFYLPEGEESNTKEDSEIPDMESDAGHTPDTASKSEKQAPKKASSEASAESSASSSSTLPTTPETPNITGRLHRGKASKLPRPLLTKLADQFSDAMPEREFSMASLQGYLMAYKIRPYDAVKDVVVWIENERKPKGDGAV